MPPLTFVVFVVMSLTVVFLIFMAGLPLSPISAGTVRALTADCRLHLPTYVELRGAVVQLTRRARSHNGSTASLADHNASAIPALPPRNPGTRTSRQCVFAAPWMPRAGRPYGKVPADAAAGTPDAKRLTKPEASGLAKLEIARLLVHPIEQVCDARGAVAGSTIHDACVKRMDRCRHSSRGERFTPPVVAVERSGGDGECGNGAAVAPAPSEVSRRNRATARVDLPRKARAGGGIAAVQQPAHGPLHETPRLPASDPGGVDRRKRRDDAGHAVRDADRIAPAIETLRIEWILRLRGERQVVERPLDSALRERRSTIRSRHSASPGSGRRSSASPPRRWCRK